MIGEMPDALSAASAPGIIGSSYGTILKTTPPEYVSELAS